jgi:hypothetical protein
MRNSEINAGEMNTNNYLSRADSMDFLQTDSHYTRATMDRRRGRRR